MRKFGVTFWFYAKDHFKPKALIWLAVYAIAIVGISWAIMHFGGAGGNPQVAIVQESDTFIIQPGILIESVEADLWFFETEEDARQLLEDGDVRDIFVIRGELRPELKVITDDAFSANQMVQATLIQLLTGTHIGNVANSYDLPMDIVMELVTPIHVEMELGAFEDFIAAEVINQVAPIIILMLVMMSGQMVANSVAAEKSSRVMEVMLGKVHPTITMITKVLSSLLGIILPMVAMVFGAVVANVTGIIDVGVVLEFVNDIFSLDALILTVVVLIIGYFCFIFLFAAAGAIANSVESLQATLAPVVYLTMAPYLAALFLPMGGTLMDVFVYIPFMTPFVIVQRFILGYATMLEIIISLSGMVVFSLLMLVISARLYMNGIFHNSEKVTLKDLRKMLQK